jgi:hypothetical protein
MFKASDSAWAPWYVVRSDDKKRARLNMIRHMLSQIPYQEAPREKVKLPKRHIKSSHETSYPVKYVPESY